MYLVGEIDDDAASSSFLWWDLKKNMISPCGQMMDWWWIDSQDTKYSPLRGRFKEKNSGKLIMSIA